MLQLYRRHLRVYSQNSDQLTDVSLGVRRKLTIALKIVSLQLYYVYQKTTRFYFSVLFEKC